MKEIEWPPCIIPKRLKLFKHFYSTYLDDLLNFNNPYFEGMVGRIYPSELPINKTNAADTKAPFLGLHLSISNEFVSSKIMISAMTLILTVYFPFFGWGSSPFYSHGVYISQLIRFARVSSHATDFKTHNKILTAKRLHQGSRVP